MEVAPAALPRGAMYHFMVSAIAPRPIAWVTTADATGIVNVAPFSWFNAVCADPPVLMVSISERSPGVPKDTLRNILDQGEFVVNVVPDGLLEQAVRTSAELPAEESEAVRFDVPLAPSRVVAAPRIASSPVHFECRLLEDRVFGDEGRPRTTLVLGSIVHIGADDGVLDARGNVDPDRLALSARMGGNWYTDTAHRRRVERPSPDAHHG